MGFSSENKKKGRFDNGRDGACITSHGQIFNFGSKHVPVPLVGDECHFPFLFQAGTMKNKLKRKRKRVFVYWRSMTVICDNELLLPSFLVADTF